MLSPSTDRFGRSVTVVATTGLIGAGLLPWCRRSSLRPKTVVSVRPGGQLGSSRDRHRARSEHEQDRTKAVVDPRRGGPLAPPARTAGTKQRPSVGVSDQVPTLGSDYRLGHGYW